MKYKNHTCPLTGISHTYPSTIPHLPLPELSLTYSTINNLLPSLIKESLDTFDSRELTVLGCAILQAYEVVYKWESPFLSGGSIKINDLLALISILPKLSHKSLPKFVADTPQSVSLYISTLKDSYNDSKSRGVEVYDTDEDTTMTYALYAGTSEKSAVIMYLSRRLYKRMGKGTSPQAREALSITIATLKNETEATYIGDLYKAYQSLLSLCRSLIDKATTLEEKTLLEQAETCILKGVDREKNILPTLEPMVELS